MSMARGPPFASLLQPFRASRISLAAQTLEAAQKCFLPSRCATICYSHEKMKKVSWYSFRPC